LNKNWKIAKLKDYIEINPKESIAKGTIAKKISMDKLQPFCRDIPEYELAEFTGGTKFRNGDTIMARITPCLENGKTSMVNVLNENEIGFGSTEYIVFRAKDGLTVPNYVYYLICSSYVREPAIKSMVGSSGRQRVQTDVLMNLEIAFPNIEEQTKISNVLKNIDDKISINNKINSNLEQQVSTLYQAWFEDYINSDGIQPETWSLVAFSDIADVNSGKRPPMKSSEKTDDAQIPLVGAASVMGFTSEANHSDKILVTGRVGTHGVIQRFNTPCWTSDNTLVITSKYYEYACQILKRIDYSSMNRGSTQPLITQGDMNKVPVLLPDANTLNEFEALAGTLMAQYEANVAENNHLANIRDTLLPKLMSGEIDLSNIDV